MFNKNFHKLHFGLIIKELIDKKNITISKEFIEKIGKSKQAIYQDFKKDDFSIKTLLGYLDILEIKFETILQDSENNQNKNTYELQEPETEYKTALKQSKDLRETEIEYLKKLLEEKERLIGVLLQK